MAQNVRVCDGCKIPLCRFDRQVRNVMEKAMNSETCHCKCLFALQKLGINVQPPALTVAAILNHTDCVKTLIESEADVNAMAAPDRVYSRTALSLAAQMGHPECVNALIAAGADVNKKEREQLTPLIYAAQGGQSECMKILIEAGADVNMETGKELNDTGMELNDTGMPYYGCKRPLYESKKTALMWVFYPESPVHRYDDSFCYHLTEDRCRALSKEPNHEECVYILLEAGADVNIIDRKGYTALAHAARQPDQTGCVKKLIKAGAYVNCTECEWCFSDKVAKVIHAAGSTKLRHKRIPDYVKQKDEERRLKHLCRVRIRNHLLELDPHENLFLKVPQLGLPKSLASYLLYDVTVDDVNDDSNNDTEW